MERKDFDREAASWDEKPERVRLANDIADAIRSDIALTLDMNVLDFGCGTGLVTLRLQPFVGSITGADSSQGMLNILSAKISQQNIANVRTLYLDPDKSESLPGPYHLIVSSMTFHHVKDIHSLVALYYRSIAPEGYLAIADLDSEGGMFHGSNEGVFHPGFEQARVAPRLHGGRVPGGSRQYGGGDSKTGLHGSDSAFQRVSHDGSEG